jgi:hypothetical protein
MTAFDPSTAYSQDYQWLDWVESVTWEREGEAGPILVDGLKGRFGDFDTADLQSLAASLALTSEAAAIVVWQPTPSDQDEPTSEDDRTFAPKSGHILRREEHDNEGWVIVGFNRSRFGHWNIAIEREVLNA